MIWDSWSSRKPCAPCDHKLLVECSKTSLYGCFLTCQWQHNLVTFSAPIISLSGWSEGECSMYMYLLYVRICQNDFTFQYYHSALCKLYALGHTHSLLGKYTDISTGRNHAFSSEVCHMMSCTLIGIFVVHALFLWNVIINTGSGPALIHDYMYALIHKCIW